MYDNNYGFINTKCSTDGKLNIYNLPTKFHCYSYDYQSTRRLYSGLVDKNNKRDDECILVMNNWDRIPTVSTLQLFALRLYEAERSADVNIKAQKTPLLLLCHEKQRFSLTQLYNKYTGNEPAIFGDKYQLDEKLIRSVDTGAPFIADKLIDYKKEIWNEALTFLGVNNILVDKKERLIQDEANSNNELINLNLQSYLSPRELACKQFNEKFGFTNTDKAISVRIRSDLHNIIKNSMSIVNDLPNNSIEEKEE